MYRYLSSGCLTLLIFYHKGTNRVMQQGNRRNCVHVGKSCQKHALPGSLATVTSGRMQSASRPARHHNSQTATTNWFCGTHASRMDHDKVVIPTNPHAMFHARSCIRFSCTWSARNLSTAPWRPAHRSRFMRERRSNTAEQTVRTPCNLCRFSKIRSCFAPNPRSLEHIVRISSVNSSKSTSFGEESLCPILAFETCFHLFHRDHARSMPPHKAHLLPLVPVASNRYNSYGGEHLVRAVSDVWTLQGTHRIRIVR